jgi:hypothetical protein
LAREGQGFLMDIMAAIVEIGDHPHVVFCQNLFSRRAVSYVIKPVL